MKDRTERELEALGHTVVRLQQQGDQIFKQRFTYDDSNHFDFMYIAFYSRQHEHLKSLKALYENECFQDMLAVAREMIEGMAILVWVYKKQDGLAERWRAFVYVSDYKLAVKQIAEGAIISEVQKQDILAGLRLYGNLFLKKNDLAELDFVHDPFKNQWSFDDERNKIVAEKFLTEINKDLYQIYRDMSDWIHWSPRGIGLLVSRNEDVVSIVFRNHQNAGYALATAILAYFASLKVFVDHFNLDLKGKIKEIEEEYAVNMSKAKAGE